MQSRSRTSCLCRLPVTLLPESAADSVEGAFLSRFIKPKSIVIDVGAGMFAASVHLVQNGHSVIAIEPDLTSVGSAWRFMSSSEEGLSLSLLPVHYEELSIDVEAQAILASALLSQLEPPNRSHFLGWCVSHLSATGVLVLSGLNPPATGSATDWECVRDVALGEASLVSFARILEADEKGDQTVHYRHEVMLRGRTLLQEDCRHTPQTTQLDSLRRDAAQHGLVVHEVFGSWAGEAWSPSSVGYVAVLVRESFFA